MSVTFFSKQKTEIIAWRGPVRGQQVVFFNKDNWGIEFAKLLSRIYSSFSAGHPRKLPQRALFAVFCCQGMAAVIQNNRIYKRPTAIHTGVNSSALEYIMILSSFHYFASLCKIAEHSDASCQNVKKKLKSEAK